MRVQFSITWVLFLILFAREALAIGCGYSPPSVTLLQQSFAEDAEGSVPAPWEPHTGHWVVDENLFENRLSHPSAIATMSSYQDRNCIAPPDEFGFDEDRFTYRLRMRNERSQANALVGVVYHYQDAFNYYEAVLSPTGIASLRVVRNGVFTTVASANYVQGGANTWVDIALIRDGQRTTLLVNGLAVFRDLAQSEYMSGRLGLVTHNTTAHFDKVVLTIPWIDDRFEEEFEGAAPTWHSNTGEWSLSGGTYNNLVVQQTSDSGAFASVALHEEAWGARGIAVRMLNPYRASGNLVGMYFHSGLGELTFSPTGVARVNLFLNGRWQTVASTPYPGRQNVWFNVVMDISTHVLSYVSVDGQKLFENIFIGDVDPSGGYSPLGIGFRTHWSPGRFDNLRVGIDIPGRPFSEPFDSLSAIENRQGLWNVENGVLLSLDAGAADIATVPCECSQSEMIYRGRMLNQYGASGNLVGLVYNYQDGFYEGDYYEAVFAPTGQAYLNKVLNGTRIRIAQGSHSVPRNVWFDVEVSRSRGYTSVKVNGQTVFDQVPQAELGPGSVGVVSHWAKARFDELSAAEYVRSR